MNFHHCLFRILRKTKTSRTDARTERWMAEQSEKSIPPHKHKMCRGYNNASPQCPAAGILYAVPRNYFTSRVIVWLCDNLETICMTRKPRASMRIYMSHLMTKPTKWHVRPAKTQISLGTHPVWSVFAGHTCHFVGFVMRRLILLREASQQRKQECENTWRIRLLATAWQNQQHDMCTQRRLRSAWASAQSSLSTWRKLGPLSTH